MKNIQIHITLLFSILLLTKGLYAESLSYQGAMDLMMQHNKKFHALQKQQEASSYAAKQRVGLRFPEIKLSAKAVHLNDDLRIDMNHKRNALSNFLKFIKPEMLGDWRYTFQKQHFGSVDLDFTYPIFAGGKINAAIKAFKIQTKITDKEVLKKQNKLISELTNRYFQSQLAEEVQKLRKQLVAGSQKHLFNAKKLEENGMIATIERLQAESAVADAQREWVVAEKNTQLARTALAGTIGVPKCPQQLTTTLFEVHGLQPLSYYQHQAKTYFPDIEKLYLMEQLATENIKAKKSAYIPTLALMGKAHLYSKNLPITEPKWFVGVGCSITIFDGMKRRNELREANVSKEQIILFREQAIQDIQVLVKKHYQEIEKQKALLLSLNKNIQFAEELLRVKTKAFKEGFARSVDIVDANLYLAATKTKRLQALYEMDIYLASLLEVCGESETLKDYIKHNR